MSKLFPKNTLKHKFLSATFVAMAAIGAGEYLLGEVGERSQPQAMAAANACQKTLAAGAPCSREDGISLAKRDTLDRSISGGTRMMAIAAAGALFLL
jgi:hypothetical protein